VPTLSETGYADLTHNSINGLFGRKEIPPELRNQVAADVRAVLNDPAVAQRLTNLGYIARPSSPEEFTSMLQQTSAKWSAIARTLGIRPLN
jgi:tripartite-type tricarboxylate transporter receptor subunit TctC